MGYTVLRLGRIRVEINNGNVRKARTLNLIGYRILIAWTIGILFGTLVEEACSWLKGVILMI